MVGSFLLMILLGMVLLLLPLANRAPLSPLDALFTATSSVCVTGLVVVDTGSHFSLFGQLIILFLIQMGGVGIMTFSIFFYRLLGREIPLPGKIALEEGFTYGPVKDIFQVVRMVLSYTLILEAVGALLLFLRWISFFPPKEAAYLSLFHAVSAFCNAGFSPFSCSLIDYRGDLWINLVFIFLIVSGGIGFVVLYELERRWRRGPLTDEEIRRFVRYHLEYLRDYIYLSNNRDSAYYPVSYTHLTLPTKA